MNLNSPFFTLILLLFSPQFSRSHDSPASSPRKSINYGPDHSTHSLKSSIYSSKYSSTSNHPLDPQSILIQFNSNLANIKASLPTDSDSSLKSLGIELATRYLHHIHPSTNLSFQLTSAHVSKHTGVLHAYFVQTIPSDHHPQSAHIRVHNAVANLNVDIDPKSPKFGHILSHSDSFHPVTQRPSGTPASLFLSSFQGQQNSRCSRLMKEFDTVLQSTATNPGADQQVLGLLPVQLSEASGKPTKKLLSDFSEEELRLIAECEMSTEGYKPVNSEIVDPRIALISFLTLAADQETENLVRSQSLDDLVQSIDVVKKSSSSLKPAGLPGNPSEAPTFELYNVPGALDTDSSDHPVSGQPTLAELAWLSLDNQNTQNSERELKMVWRFEYRSNSNWYESYVDATSPGEVPMVVDWIKDFRPTSDVAPTYADHLTMKASLAEALEDSSFSTKPSRISPSSLSVPETDLPSLPEGSTGQPRSASYRVFPWSVNDPTQGKREIIESPSDPIASPLGWHTIPRSDLTGDQRDISNLSKGWSRHVSKHGLRAIDTRGNNVYAQENWEGLDNWEGNHRPNGTEELKFHFHLGWNQTDDPSQTHVNPKRYIDAAVSELFYTCNEFHDLTYRYGFDEESGNFQEHNFDRGGKGGDAVIANAQDGSGYNNANFATPPDGRNGRMRMYVWNGAEPWRDGDLEAGIVIHEYSHGVSTRLTGGPANSACLGWGEAGGMGEGWGDFFATLVRMHKAKPVDFTMGEWASGVKGGIRKYKYSLDTKVNPETYTTLDKPGYWGVHAMGEVWAEMLFTVAEELIAKHGFQSSLFPPSGETDSDGFFKISELNGKRVPKAGNTLVFQLVLDGMKIQPCRPGFFDARDAILEADAILTGGENQCEIWKGFSKRGLGPKAEVKGRTPWGGGIRTDDFSLPEGVCQN